MSISNTHRRVIRHRAQHGIRAFSYDHRIEVYVTPNSPIYNLPDFERQLMKELAQALSVLNRTMKWHRPSQRGTKTLTVQIAPSEQQPFHLTTYDMQSMMRVVCDAAHDFLDRAHREATLAPDPVYLYNDQGRYYICGMLEDSAARFGKSLGFEYDDQKRLYFTQSPTLAKHIAQKGDVQIRRGAPPKRYVKCSKCSK